MRWLACCLAVMLAACGESPSVLVGRGAVLVDPGAAEIPFEVGPTARSRTKAKPKIIPVPVGTEVVVLAIDGDLARVQVKAGEHAGLIDWVKIENLGPPE